MESARRGQGQSFIRAYPIRNGTASILSYLYQNDDGRPSLAKPVGSPEQFSTPSPLLARQKECQIIEGHLMSDQVHMCPRLRLAIPPKHPVASVIGFLKGKAPSRSPASVVENETSPASTSGPAVTQDPPSGSAGQF